MIVRGRDDASSDSETLTLERFFFPRSATADLGDALYSWHDLDKSCPVYDEIRDLKTAIGNDISHKCSGGRVFLKCCLVVSDR